MISRSTRRISARRWQIHPQIRPWLSVTLLLGLAILLGRFEVFGPNGYLALRQKEREYQNEAQALKNLRAQNRQLHRNIQELKSDPTSIEKIAREELHLTKPGEVVYTYGRQDHSVDDIHGGKPVAGN